MSASNNETRVVMTKKCGRLTVQLIYEDLEHLPDHGVFKINDVLVVKIAPIMELYRINDPLFELLDQLRSYGATMDRVIRAIQLSDNYVHHNVSVNDSSRPLLPYYLSSYNITTIDGSYVYLTNSVLDSNPDILDSNRSLQENADVLAKAIRDYQLKSFCS